MQEFLGVVERTTGYPPEKRGNSYMACCPGHDDNPKKKSLSIRTGTKGGILIKCHAGTCSQDDILKRLGLSLKDLMPPRLDGWHPDGGKTWVKEGITFPSTWFKSKIVDAYIYRNAMGEPIYAVLRTQPKKDFPQGRIIGNTWKSGLDGCERVLYDLPGLLVGIQSGTKTVYIVEGEKDKERINKAGGLATCNSGGAGSWEDKYGHFLQGTFCIIVRDKDGAGKDHVRKVAASLRNYNVPYKIVEAVEGKDAYDHLEAGHGLDDFIDVEEDLFKVMGGKTFAAKKDEGGTKWACLANFAAMITMESYIDNGLKAETFFTIEGKTQASDKPKVFEIRAADFASMSWIIPNLGAKAIISPGQNTKDLLRVAIQHLSEPEQRTIYAQAGWQEIDGVRHFITNAGGIAADGLNTALEVDLARVGLAPLAVEPADGYLDALAKLRSSIAPEVWAPLIGTVFLAPLRPFVDPDYALLICGESGKFKSEVAAIAQSFYGKFRRTNLPANFDSTDNYVELVLHAGKDCAIVVDDYYPANDKIKANRLSSVLDRILRGVGNSSARGRLNSDSQARSGYTPKAIPIITAEKLPAGQSNTSRAYILELEGEIVSAIDLTELQRMAKEGLFAGAMFDYLSWVASNWEALGSKVAGQFEKIRLALATDGHRRATANSAWILLGVWAYCEWMREAGHMQSDLEMQDVAGSALMAVKDVAERSAVRIEGNSYPHIFIEALKEGFLRQKICLQTKTGGSPDDADRFGWQMSGISGGWITDAELVGYLHNDQIWLLPGAAYSYVIEYSRSQDIAFSLDQVTLFRRLADRGLLCKSQDSGSPTEVAFIQGKSVRVLKLPRELFYQREQSELPIVA